MNMFIEFAAICLLWTLFTTWIIPRFFRGRPYHRSICTCHEGIYACRIEVLHVASELLQVSRKYGTLHRSIARFVEVLHVASELLLQAAKEHGTFHRSMARCIRSITRCMEVLCVSQSRSHGFVGTLKLCTVHVRDKWGRSGDEMLISPSKVSRSLFTSRLDLYMCLYI